MIGRASFYIFKGEQMKKKLTVVFKCGYVLSTTCLDYDLVRHSDGTIKKFTYTPANQSEQLIFIDPKDISLIITSKAV